MRLLLAAFFLLEMGWGELCHGQNPFIFEEKLYLAPDQVLLNGAVLSSGQTTWNIGLLGTGNLEVAGEKFNRTATSSLPSETAVLTNTAFTPFISDSWVMRATVVGTNGATNTPYNSLILSVGGPAGAYGWRVLLNRTDGNPDFNFGQDGSFNNLFNGDMFVVNSLFTRPIQMTFVNRNSTLHAFVDDFTALPNPTNLLVSSTPTTGTLGAATWDNATVTLGARDTGTVDDVRFYNVRAAVETFLTSPSLATIDPLPPVYTFDNAWNILDANSPARWRASMNRLEWLGGASNDPQIMCEPVDANFTSDSWIFEATITFANTSNLAANRLIFELEPQAGTTLGIVVPRTASTGRRLLIYTGTESNIVASSNFGTDIPVNFRVRFSIICVRGQMQLRVNDRTLIAGDPQTGFGSQTWRRVHVRGDRQYAFSVDAMLYHNIGTGLLGVSSAWTEYE